MTSGYLASTEKEEVFTEVLQDWFQTYGRSFPWRETSNPFHLLLAEVLLRKTQAERVAPVYTMVCSRFSTPKEFLGVKQSDVYVLLEGLGLKQRLNWLQELCVQLVNNCDGEVPRHYEELVRLKGIGPYAAQMIQCAIHGEPVIPIDNNVARLVSRFFGTRRVHDTRREKEVDKVLKRVVIQANPRILAFAILDFAAILCTAVKPKCHVCRLAYSCYWRLKQMKA